jgi:prophage regulatory protein
MDAMARARPVRLPDPDASPSSLLADVHEALGSGDVAGLTDWLDVVGWVSGLSDDESAVAPRPDAPLDPGRLLSIQETCAITGLGRATLWRLRRRGAFPAPADLSVRRLAWRAADVAAWIASRPSLA